MNQYERWDRAQIDSTMTRLRDDNKRLRQPKTFRYCAIAAVAFAGGWYVHAIAIKQVNLLETELMANEAACKADVPSYPVTKWGELRGCLQVKTGPMGPINTFIQKGLK